MKTHARTRAGRSLTWRGVGIVIAAALGAVACGARASASLHGDLVHAGITVHVVDGRLHIEGGEIRFETGSSELVGGRTHRTLEALAMFLADHPKLVLRVEGHTDSRGRPDDNLELSQARADALRTFLIESGIDGARIVAVGLGESQPKVVEPRACRNRPAHEAPAECEARYWSLNRRSEFVIIGGEP